MPVPIPSGQVTLLNGAHYNVHVNVQMVPAGGGVFNPTDLLVRGRISYSMDESVGTMELEFDRSSGTDSLSPFMASSTWNDNGPLLYPGNFVTLEVCVTAEGDDPDVFTSIFIGRVDSVDVAGPGTITIRCSDSAAHFLNRQIKVVRKYSGAVEDVIAQVIDDNFAPGQAATSLEVIGTPTFSFTEFLLSEQRVLEAIRGLAREAGGWDVRTRVRGSGKLVFYDPGRDRTTPDLTVSASEYFDVQKLELDDADVRNQWEGWYNGASRLRYYEEDAASMLQHGPRYARLAEDAQSHLDTLGEITAMVQAALADTKDPLADHSITLPFRPDLELNDLVEFVANNDHYSLNQKWALATISHEFEGGWGITTLGTRGAPMAALRDWRRGVHRDVHVYTAAPPADTYLDGAVYRDGDFWAEVADVAIP